MSSIFQRTFHFVVFAFQNVFTWFWHNDPPSKHSLYWCNVCMLHLQCKHAVFIDRGNPSLHQRLRNNRPIWLSIQSHPTCCQRIKTLDTVVYHQCSASWVNWTDIWLWKYFIYVTSDRGIITFKLLLILWSSCLAVCRLLSFTALSWLEYKWQRAVLVYGLFIHTAQVVLTGWSLETPCPQSMMVITMVTLLPSPSPHLYTRLLFPVSLTLDLKNLNFQFRGILILWLSWGLFHYWWEISWARMIHWILHAVFPAITKGT